LACGVHDASKSFSMDWTNEIFGQDIVMTVSRRSRCVDSRNGNQDAAVLQEHEANPEALGVGGGGRESFSSLANQMKDSLTSGQTTTEVLSQKGGRAVVKLVLRNNSVRQLATNIPEHRIPKPTLSRFLVTRPRSSSSTALNLGQGESAKEESVRSASMRGLRWLGHMARAAFTRIAAGVMGPVRTPFTDAMLPRILCRAGEIGLPYTGARRPFERTKCVVEALVVIRAVIVVFGYRDGSPSACSRQFDERDFLHLQRHLTDETDPAILPCAIGLVADQWERPGYYQVIQALKTEFFQPDGAAALSPDLVDNGYLVSTSYSFGANNEARLKKLASRLRKHCDVDELELVSLLEDLMEIKVKASDQKAVPALVVMSDELRVQVSLLEQNSRFKLKRAVQDILQPSWTRPALVLFGPAHMNPASFETISLTHTQTPSPVPPAMRLPTAAESLVLSHLAGTAGEDSSLHAVADEDTDSGDLADISDWRIVQRRVRLNQRECKAWLQQAVRDLKSACRAEKDPTHRDMLALARKSCHFPAPLQMIGYPPVNTRQMTPKDLLVMTGKQEQARLKRKTQSSQEAPKRSRIRLTK
jgi:hypothetical protein